MGQTGQPLYNRLKRVEVFYLEMTTLKGPMTKIRRMNNHCKPLCVTMEHLMKVVRNKFRTGKDQNIFTQKVVDFWNFLPQEFAGSRKYQQVQEWIRQTHGQQVYK